MKTDSQTNNSIMKEWPSHPRRKGGKRFSRLMYKQKDERDERLGKKETNKKRKGRKE